MPKATKPKKIGRPKLPKGEAKGRIVPVRFSAEEVQRITKAATASKQKVSESDSRNHRNCDRGTAFMTPSHDFDWVAAREKCSPVEAFQRLKLGVKADAEARTRHLLENRATTASLLFQMTDPLVSFFREAGPLAAPSCSRKLKTEYLCTMEPTS